MTLGGGPISVAPGSWRYVLIKKLLLAALVVAAPSMLAAMQEEDPYLWLEEVQGARAIQQVEQWNKATEDDLSRTPGYAEHRNRALNILNDVRQIALPDEVQGDFITNFWRDAEHPRGLWRISPRAAYLAGRPQWRV
ncbi:MAG: prolyl oligopeptidase, partial [Sphingomonadales bacterium]|nr:prolyl oligopeptidase [Sphingomonadales bacterium]